MKSCKGCFQNLPYKRFNKSRRTKDGYEGKCRSCRQDARKKYLRTCEICENEFRTAKKNTRLCSQKCVGKLRTSKHMVETKCKACDSELIIPLYSLAENNYCDSKCYGIILAKRMTGERVKRIKFLCEYCGKDVLKTESRSRGVSLHFCDKECFSLGIGKFRKDPNLSDEVRSLNRNYPEYSLWRLSVFKRDNYKCQACFTDSVTLHAHHIYNYSSHEKLRTEVTNGITLCQACHLEFHRVYGFKSNTRRQLDEYLTIKLSL